MQPLDIKICGLRTAEALDAALRHGATHVGFIFFPKSPRHVSVTEAATLAEGARGKTKIVAVSVDAEDQTLDAIVEVLRPDMLQLHGTETPKRVDTVKRRFGLPVMKAISVASADDLRRAEPYRGIADRLLFDAKAPKGAELPGGNGVAFDWALLADLDAGQDYMLSGGLNAANVGSALKQAGPAGLDVSSGVEQAPGVKDPALIERFFAAVKTAREQDDAGGRGGE